jgi:hypothetical protein
MAETVKGVVDFYDEAPEIDRRAIYEQMWSLSEELTARVMERFELTRDPSSDDLEHYGAEPGEGLADSFAPTPGRRWTGSFTPGLGSRRSRSPTST